MKNILIACMGWLLYHSSSFAQSCPDCVNYTYAATNATGYGCNGELNLTFNASCQTQINLTGTSYNGTPVSIWTTPVTDDSAHFDLLAGTYAFTLYSYDGLTQQCNTASIPFTITQPVCDFDLNYSFGSPDYCLGSIPVSILSNNQGCSNTPNNINYMMKIDGITSYNHAPVVIDMPLGSTGTYTVYNYDFNAGSLQAVCSEDITITAPNCAFSVSLAATQGTNCSNHKITVTKTGDVCFDWSADLMLNGNYDTTITSTSNQIEFTGLTNGSYDITAYTGVCIDNKSTVLNYCVKPSSLASTSVTSTSAKVKWSKLTCALGYTIQYRPLGTTTWTTKTNTTNVSNKVLTGLNSLQTYEWRVRAKCSNSPVQYSPYANIKTFTTSAPRFEDSATSNAVSEELELSLYPNPADKYMNISFESNGYHATLELINLTGQVLAKKQLSSRDGSFTDGINVEWLRPGLYMLLVRTEDNFASKRFVKE